MRQTNKMARISLICAMSRNRVIGQDNQLPWELPDDLARFRRLTQGHPFIMGRKSYESDDALLSDRLNLILTSRQQLPGLGDNCRLVHSLEEALAAAAGYEEVFVLGGASVFEQAIDRADRLYLTEVQAEMEGDAFFPETNRQEWEITEERYHPVDERHEYDFYFRNYRRRAGG